MHRAQLRDTVARREEVYKNMHMSEGEDWKGGKWRPAGENMRNGLRGKEKVKDKAVQEGITKKIRDRMKRVRQ